MAGHGSGKGGRRGPAKTPSKLLFLRGSHLVNDRGQEPQPPVIEGADLTPPQTLSPGGQAIWQKLAVQLRDCGILTAIDLVAFERYCDYLDKFRVIQAKIKEAGFDKDGRIRWRETRAMLVLESSLSRIEQQFGMTPASRASLRVNFIPGKKEKDEKAEYFK